MRIYIFIILLLSFCLVPVSGSAKVYHYIDKDGVERYSNQPPPEGAKIIGETKEVKYDKAADNAQQERNREAAAEEEAAQPAPTPAVKPTQPSGGNAGETVIYEGDGGTVEQQYSRRKHRRKKEIRKENAEKRKAMEAVEVKK